jgi:hypothetical protein
MPNTLNLTLADRMIPSFDGSESNLFKFIEMSQLIYDTCTSEQDKNYFKMIILGKLESTAFELARSVDHLNWEELKIHLEQRFSESKSVAQLQLELTQQKQKSDIKEFSTRLLLILSSLNRAINATEGMQLDQTVRTMNELLALKTFISNLRTNIGMVVRASKPTTLSKAIELALEEEGILNNLNNANKISPKSDIFHRTNENSNPNQEKSSENLDYLPSNQNPQIKKEIFCGYCNQAGHDIFNCFHPACEASRVNKNQFESHNHPEFNSQTNPSFNENSHQPDSNNVYFIEDCRCNSFNEPRLSQNNFPGNESQPFDIETIEEATD